MSPSNATARISHVGLHCSSHTDSATRQVRESSRVSRYLRVPLGVGVWAGTKNQRVAGASAAVSNFQAASALCGHPAIAVPPPDNSSTTMAQEQETVVGATPTKEERKALKKAAKKAARKLQEQQEAVAAASEAAAAEAPESKKKSKKKRKAEEAAAAAAAAAGGDEGPSAQKVSGEGEETVQEVVDVVFYSLGYRLCMEDVLWLSLRSGYLLDTDT